MAPAGRGAVLLYGDDPRRGQRAGIAKNAAFYLAPPPQVLGVPPPPQVCGFMQGPQSSRPPQLSAMLPQVAPACAQVRGVQVTGHIPQSSSPPQPSPLGP